MNVRASARPGPGLEKVKPKGPRSKMPADEVGAIRKRWRGRTRVALVYPNRYHVGMSNLGLQAVYGLLNRRDDVVCERVFLPEDDESSAGRLTTLESGRPVADVDIIAFSVSFESDYPHLLTLLARAGIPPRAAERRPHDPLVIAGGVACFLNPEPIAGFLDCILVGEAEQTLPPFLEVFARRADRSRMLGEIAREVPGAYVPAFYRVDYHPDGTLAAFTPEADVPPRVVRPRAADLTGAVTCSTVVASDTAFGRTFLVEVGRGCPHGCRFCSAGFIYRPPRFQPVEILAEAITRGLERADRIGLVGAAVSDHPGIGELCARFAGEKVAFSFSSLRADALSPELIEALRASGVKTATIAPEAGSERLRRVINKGIREEDVLAAAEKLVANGIPNLKLYFMVGLPTETREDVEAIATLVKQIKHRFLRSSRGRGAIGTITVSVGSFVPKPFTPFQWSAMAEVGELKNKIKHVKKGLKQVANVRVHADVPRWAYVQGLLARGDRRVADILARVQANSGNWAQALKNLALNPDFHALRERGMEELLPWDFIDHRISKSFLKKELRRALAGKPGPLCTVGACEQCGVCAPAGPEPG